MKKKTMYAHFYLMGNVLVPIGCFFIFFGEQADGLLIRWRQTGFDSPAPHSPPLGDTQGAVAKDLTKRRRYDDN
jgi:hypothetical protein